MATVQQLVDAVLQEGGFDATQDQALRWLSARHASMVARSRAYRRVLAQPTVIGQQDYPLDPAVVEVLAVNVDGLHYGRATYDDLLAGEQSYLLLSGDGGVVAPSESAVGARQVRLFPAPTAVGTLQVRAVMLPPDLSVSDNATLKVDGDMADALISGAIATALHRVEHRPDLAASHEQVFQSACEEMRIRVQRRYRGSGPASIRLPPRR